VRPLKVIGVLVVIIGIISVYIAYQRTEVVRVELLPGESVTIGGKEIYLFNVVIDKQWLQKSYHLRDCDVTGSIFLKRGMLQIGNENMVVIHVEEKPVIVIGPIPQEKEYQISEKIKVKFIGLKPRTEEINGIFYPKVPSAILEFRFN